MAAEKTTENTAPTPSHSGDLSRALTEIREARGLNVNQVAEALCLSPRIITALEEERLDALPEPPYVRGYLRSYAKFAEVDDGPIVDAYEKLRGADPQEMDYRANIPSGGGAAYSSSSRSGMSSGILRAGLLILLVGMLALLTMIPGVRGWFTDTWNNFSEQTSGEFPEGSEENPLLTGNIPAPLPIDETISTDTSDTAPSTTPNGAAPVEGETAATGDGATENQANAGFPSVSDNSGETDAEGTDAATAADGADDGDNTNTADVPEGSSQIKLTFNDEVWMRIRDPNKKRLFETLAKQGDTKELVLERPLTFRVGNAQKLDIMVDGKPFDMTPHIRGSVATFTIE